MRILVYMRDGRTVYAVKGRGLLARLVGAEPWHEENSVKVQRGIWNPTTGDYVWMDIWIRYISKSSISVVEQDTGQGPTA